VRKAQPHARAAYIHRRGKRHRVHRAPDSLPPVNTCTADWMADTSADLAAVRHQSRWQVNWLLSLVRRCRAGRMGRVRKPGGLGCGIPAYDRLVILRCTSKLLAVIGSALAAKPAPAPDAEDWYANLLWFDRRKCLLLTRAGA
jgi:hypothetical protein